MGAYELGYYGTMFLVIYIVVRLIVEGISKK